MIETSIPVPLRTLNADCFWNKIGLELNVKKCKSVLKRGQETITLLEHFHRFSFFFLHFSPAVSFRVHFTVSTQGEGISLYFLPDKNLFSFLVLPQFVPRKAKWRERESEENVAVLFSCSWEAEICLFSVGGIKWTEEKRHRVHFRLLSFFLPFLFGHVTSLILGFRLLERKKNVLLIKILFA